MNCQKCGNTMSPNMKFCAKCGTPVAAANTQQPVNNQPAKMPVQAQVQQPADAKPPKKAKKKSGKKNNLALKIIAIILVIAVFASGGLILADNIMYKNEEVKADEYITDFPVLKTKTEFMVYDAKKFPAESYRIKVERLKKRVGILKSEAFRSTEKVFDETSSDKIYMIDFEENGEYRITLTDITATRTQPVTGTTAKSEETGKTIVVDVKVDNDNKEAVDKVTINSKPSDEPIKNFDDVDNTPSSTFIEATEEDLENLESWATCSHFNSYAYKDFDCTTANTQYILDEMVLPHYIGGYEFFFGEATFYDSDQDPLSEFTQLGFWKIPEENIKWICENIYNVKYQAVTEDVVNESGIRYLHDGYFYQRDPAFGDAGWDEADVKKYEIVDGKYEIILDNFSCYEDWETGDLVRDLMCTAKITAEIKIIDGERYWSIYKIEEYVPDSEQSAPQTENKDETTETVENVKVGDYIKFGKYEQDNNTSNGKEDIEWLVLEVQSDKAFVISKDVLECCCGNRCFGDSDARWDKSAVRTWLNNDFMKDSFTDEEKSSIVKSTVKADANPDYSCEQGSDTQDYVFLLSAYEAEKYLDSADKMESRLTEYCMSNSHIMRDSETGVAWWMLRTSAGGNCYMFVNNDEIATAGRFDDMGIRPAMWINLK